MPRSDHEPRNQIERIEWKLDLLLTEVRTLAIDQETFDTDLAALVTAVGDLEAAIETWLSTHPDLSAEDQAVQDAAAGVAAELAKLAPPPPPAP